MSTILFRTNAGPNIGFGHLTRCRAIAHALTLRGYTCAMIGPDLAYSSPRDNDIFDEWSQLSESEILNNDLGHLIHLSKKYCSNLAVLDDYSINEEYQLNLKNLGLKCLQFAGIHKTPIWADIFVNASPSASRQDYNSLIRNKNTQFLLGPSYAPLRAEFASESLFNCKVEVNHIFVMFGGGNDCGAIKFVLSRLLFLVPVGIKFIVVSGKSNPNNLELEKWIEINGLSAAIALHINPSNIDELYRSCDMAIMASGTSSYEALSCGLPAILLPIAENQIPGAEGWSNLTAAVNLGPFKILKSSHLIKAVISMIANFDERKRLSSLGMKLCDGKGASRIATVIETYL